jgi:hypothetical protein
MSKRCELCASSFPICVGKDAGPSVGNRWRPPVRVMQKRAVKPHKPCHGGPMTAAPRTAATWPTELRQTEQPLRGNLREPPWLRPPTAVAALKPLRIRFSCRSRSSSGYSFDSCKPLGGLMVSRAEPIFISAMPQGVSGSTNLVRCGARPRRVHRGEPGRGTVVGP